MFEHSTLTDLIIFLRLINIYVYLGGRVRSGGEGGGEDSMMTEPGVIQVTPQDKEAIERVRNL